MKDKGRAFMERQVDLAMSGWPEYEVEGDEYSEPENPLLESFPHQAELKEYLVKKGYIEFWGTRTFGGKVFNVLGSRGNLAWCCDPECDKVIVGVPITLFVDEGRQGEIAQHQDCFERNLRGGYYSLAKEASDATTKT